MLSPILGLLLLLLGRTAASDVDGHHQIHLLWKDPYVDSFVVSLRDTWPSTSFLTAPGHQLHRQLWHSPR